MDKEQWAEFMHQLKRLADHTRDASANIGDLYGAVCDVENAVRQVEEQIGCHAETMRELLNDAQKSLALIAARTGS